jgi:hypothetical protein
MAALDHGRGAVLGQVEVGCKTNEIPLFSTLLDDIDLTRSVVTADALHAQRDHADYLVDQRGAHFLLTVKRNQCAARRLVVFPIELGGIRRGIPGSDGLPGSEKRKGTVACH